MSKNPWKPWHDVVKIREDLRSGELSLAMFAADLYDVAMKKGLRPVYEDPAQFFALTYPTLNLRELAKDVILRLAGKNDKAVRQLELTYGGGKTHTLITLLHLVGDPARLPDLPAVSEFVQHIGMKPPQARVAVLPFDHLDPVAGMEVKAPDGKTARFKHPWTVLAWQLGGPEGIKILGTEDGKEREVPPFTNVLEDLLRLPGRQDLSTLVLMDEVLMWARTKVGADRVWLDRIQDFFQCLTQAAVKVDRCAVVASLLATDPAKSDTLGKEIIGKLYDVFRREREEGVQPVTKEDVAEVLRRRFFTPKSLEKHDSFGAHMMAAVKGVADLDEQTRKDRKSAEDRFLRDYPFHPDLTEVLYGKWTGMEKFQRTRGVLRTFALALRDAENWDDSPLIGVNVFLGAPGKVGISESAHELTTVAATEEYEGKKQEWTAILEGELAKARAIEKDFPGLRHREIEQAVFAVFLHSQPIGQRALTRDLILLLGPTRPDRIELEKGLRRWTESSWFLDEGAINDADTGLDGTKQLPKSWRLGSRPNLRQMHDESCSRVPPPLIDARLIDEIARLKNLTAGASAAGAKVHNLPALPKDVEDDGEFHYAVLGPKAASEAGKPSNEARRFIEETTATDRLRVRRNAVVLAVPSRDGLELARDRIREYLGWEEVRAQLKDQDIDPIRQEMLLASIEAAKRTVPEAIRQAYSIAVAVSEKNEIQAFKVAVGNDPLFTSIKMDPRSRIQDTAVSADALLPGGPYDLWREGETSRRLKDLVGSFSEFYRLPKMLNRKAILDTLVEGCRKGTFALRVLRPDRSVRTFWRERPDEIALKDPGMEVVLPAAASLTEIPPVLLKPGILPGLWDRGGVSVADLLDYFSGTRVVQEKKEGYEEPVPIPKAERPVVEAAVHGAVKTGYLWLTCGPSSILGEDIPAGLLANDALLQPPPPSIPHVDIFPERLPDAWVDGGTTAMTISVALSRKQGKTLPWGVVRDAIDGALRARFLELAEASGPWPCDLAVAHLAKLRLTGGKPVVTTVTVDRSTHAPGILLAEAELQAGQVQDFAEIVGDLQKTAAGYGIKYRFVIEIGGEKPARDDVRDAIRKLLQGISKEWKIT